MKNMQYNTDKTRLRMSEYGRIIQDMANHCMNIKDKQERQTFAQDIIFVMASLGQEKLNNPEVQFKLWNHLAFITDFKLDIDYPVEIIPRTEVYAHPSPMPLPQKTIRHKHYGHIIEEALRHLEAMPEGEERDCLVRLAADRMKQNLFSWNPDVMSEDKVANDIDNYTHGHNLGEALNGHQYANLHTIPTNILKKKKK